MRKSYRELWLALLAIIVISLIYLTVLTILGDIPEARGFFGHTIGILGFVLMIMTETLYSLRKRSRSARWGQMAAWLQFHIFTGIVGPFLVLLHSSWKFNGLAGIVLLLTITIVISGFIGRYIFTAIPRTVDGVEIEAEELKRQLDILDQAIRIDKTRPGKEIQALRKRQRTLQQQVNSLALTRRALSAWHTIHIPIGLVLFSLAFVHSLGAIYYATLLR